MFHNPFSTSNGKFFLGLIPITPGFFLQCLWPWHSLHNDIGFVLVCSGFAIWYFGTYLFVSLVLLTASAILNFIPQVSHIVSQILIALAVILGFWGWWQDRQTKIAQKKMRFEKKLN